MATQWTVEERDALKAAIATGALSVQYEDEKVTYRSLAEMRALLTEMEGTLAGTRRSGLKTYNPRTRTGL